MMRHFLFSAVILGAAVLLEGAPADEVCKKEIMKAKECARPLPNVMRLHSPQEFERIQKGVDGFYNCLGTPKCDITKSILNMEKEQLRAAEKMSQLHHCLGNNQYDKSKNACRDSFKKKDCSKGALDTFVECIAGKLADKPGCSSEDITEFKKLSEPMALICQLKQDHQKNFAGFGRGL